LGLGCNFTGPCVIAAQHSGMSITHSYSQLRLPDGSIQSVLAGTTLDHIRVQRPLATLQETGTNIVHYNGSFSLEEDKEYTVIDPGMRNFI
jgi:hypothetical protein